MISGSGLLAVNASQTRRAELSEADSFIGATSCQGGFEEQRTGISIYHFVGTPLWPSIQWVVTSARNSPNEANEVAVCQRGLVFPVLEESSERVNDSTDFRKDIRVSFGKESISLAPLHLVTKTGGVRVWTHWIMRLTLATHAGECPFGVL